VPLVIRFAPNLTVLGREWLEMPAAAPAA
jgi:hypothetical protein